MARSDLAHGGLCCETCSPRACRSFHRSCKWCHCLTAWLADWPIVGDCRRCTPGGCPSPPKTAFLLRAPFSSGLFPSNTNDEPQQHPGGLRDVLGLRSAVNTTLRVMNPSGAACSVQGVFHPPYRPLQVDASILRGQPRQLALKGGGGEFGDDGMLPMCTGIEEGCSGGMDGRGSTGGGLSTGGGC